MVIYSDHAIFIDDDTTDMVSRREGINVDQHLHVQSIYKIFMSKEPRRLPPLSWVERSAKGYQIQQNQDPDTCANESKAMYGPHEIKLQVQAAKRCSLSPLIKVLQVAESPVKVEKNENRFDLLLKHQLSQLQTLEKNTCEKTHH